MHCGVVPSELVFIIIHKMVSKSDQKFRLGRAYRDVCMKIAEAQANVIMVNSMIRKRIATNDI